MMSAQVVVVGLDLGPERLASCAALLDPEEMARADRFLRPADRNRFMASHAALRIILGEELGHPPEALVFDREAGGRPFVADPAGTSLDFNLSHSGDLAVIGLAHGARIGVDVEARRALPDALRIARSHFAVDETAALGTLPPEDREEAFFALWTRKEAVVKALGAGLSLPLGAFSLTVPPAPPRLLRIAGGTERWSLASPAVGPGSFATVAVMAPGCEIRSVALAGDWIDKFRAK